MVDSDGRTSEPTGESGRPASPLLALVVCGAPPASAIEELVQALLENGWDVNVVATEAATSWINLASLQILTGNPVRSKARQPHEAKAARPHTVVVAPATFNTINQWGSGINNTAALGLLNEAICSGVPVIAAPYVKEAMTAHPAFRRNIEMLAEAGVHFTSSSALRPHAEGGPYNWQPIHDLLSVAGVT